MHPITSETMFPGNTIETTFGLEHTFDGTGTRKLIWKVACITTCVKNGAGMKLTYNRMNLGIPEFLELPDFL